MVTSGLIGLIIIAWLLMWGLARTARKLRHTPQRWQSGLVLFWALIWTGWSICTDEPLRSFFLRNYSLSSDQLVGIAAFLSLLSYALIYVWMKKTPVSPKYLDQIEEIGNKHEP